MIKWLLISWKQLDITDLETDVVSELNVLSFLPSWTPLVGRLLYTSSLTCSNIICTCWLRNKICRCHITFCHTLHCYNALSVVYYGLPAYIIITHSFVSHRLFRQNILFSTPSLDSIRSFVTCAALSYHFCIVSSISSFKKELLSLFGASMKKIKSLVSQCRRKEVYNYCMIDFNTL